MSTASPIHATCASSCYRRLAHANNLRRNGNLASSVSFNNSNSCSCSSSSSSLNFGFYSGNHSLSGPSLFSLICFRKIFISLDGLRFLNCLVYEPEIEEES